MRATSQMLLSLFGFLALSPATPGESRAAPALSGEPNQYIVTNSVLSSSVAGCDALLADPDKRFGAFDVAVCRFHLLRSTTDRKVLPLLLTTIEALQNVQTRGATTTRQQFANLMEGLLHCRVAALEYDPRLNKDEAQSILFCASRRNAQATFSAIDFHDVHVAYQDTGVTLNDLVPQVGGCYGVGGPLNGELNNSCGLVSSLDDGELRRVVADVFRTVVAEYFEAADAPMTAMFQRKQKIAANIKTLNTEKLKRLERESKTLGEALLAGRGYYDQNVAKQLGQLMSAYQQTLAVSTAIINTYSSWSSGLFVSKAEGEKKYNEVLDALAAQFAELVLGFEKADGHSVHLTRAKAALAHLGKIKSERFGVARKLCQIYYCELSVKPASADTIGWDFENACLGTKDNPLCPSQSTKLTVNNVPFTLAGFCQEAGFPAEFGRVALTESDANRCWKVR